MNKFLFLLNFNSDNSFPVFTLFINKFLSVGSSFSHISNKNKFFGFKKGIKLLIQLFPSSTPISKTFPFFFDF